MPLLLVGMHSWFIFLNLVGHFVLGLFLQRASFASGTLWLFQLRVIWLPRSETSLFKVTLGPTSETSFLFLLHLFFSCLIVLFPFHFILCPVLFSLSGSFLLPSVFCCHVPVLAVVSFSLSSHFLCLSFPIPCAFIFFRVLFLSLSSSVSSPVFFSLSASMSCSLPFVSCSFFLFLVLSFCLSIL